MTFHSLVGNRHMDMKERCSKCGEGCVEGGDQWNKCVELSDEEWLQLLVGGMLFTDFFEVPF